ncbi:hybrid-cluster NAD(P)-dependent oxidoreductase [Phaeobacter inhibens]|uniref:hybrid-cluster NAD(P)-dependent oxidoreductase n=1 Tax=Phaeobacter inhibens TaxID=221822 RepID=UPI0009718742|nr:hybrid-cluster NAD(P)-dependent oxidoreductase [Phaeobacter inhibens]APX16889.1 hybrid-cluster NAD(P)-dependent oxidoreductase [Phaeobacter inhibens]AUQ57405.1 phenylacetic acid degradation NADH oxidoreductase [Phaeobacter inhibens]AUQ61461.1 phenylacetic acid degradation NADH oxidoreductase [Phaeobacter inhibens]AUQ81428.1 phenylacetic acid degradation NADH oxidoreductase [Phaeobacter inhibens]AUQ89091.1 phenylacetic acid degradation NADH oxidoreductase [Phaeobacter inhibens]
MNELSQKSAPAIWSDSELLECVSVVPEMPNTASFSFRAPSGALFAYDPGQFLTLEIPALDQPGGMVHRTYTISSSPSRPRSITITAKAQPDSIGTRWMLDNLKPGMTIRAIGPAGLFSNAGSRARKYLFISAGSGITPMMSMTTCMWDEGGNLDVVFINCASRPSEIIFRQRLEQMASRTPGLDLKFVVEEPDSYRPWTGYQGYFNQLMLGLMAPDYLDREVYCCGPEPFMQAVREALTGLGFDMENYHQESFGAPVETEADAPDLDDVVPDSATTAELHFSLSDVTHKCTETDTVLGAAKAAGLNIPSGCTFGVCGTCKVKKTEGEVHMVHNGGISEDDIEAGYILACCSNPIGSVSVEI